MDERDPEGEMEDLLRTLQIVINNRESLEETLGEGDELEKQRTAANYLASVNTLVRHSYRVTREIDAESAERKQGELWKWFDGEV